MVVLTKLLTDFLSLLDLKIELQELILLNMFFRLQLINTKLKKILSGT
jgi:hypothetical protein